jgi:modulator of FtsH protease HflK
VPSEADKIPGDLGATESDPHQVARTALGGLILTVAVAVLALYAAFATRSFAVAGAALHLVLGALVWGFVLLTAQREARAAAEALEAQRLEALAAEGRQALFNASSGAGPEVAGLDRFRAGGHAVLTLLLSAAAIGGAVYLGWRYPLSEVRPSLGIAASLGAAAFVLLLLGRYAFALARRGLLAAGARRSLSSAGVSLIACLALAAQFKGLEQADLMGYGLVAVEALLGVEGLLLLVLEVYRPRRRGEVPRPAFDSRLLGLLSAPSEVARSIARAVDYQFGFSLSETWLYQFSARWVAPVLLFMIGSFWLLSALVVVEPHQVVLLRRLGRLQAEPLGPGLHLKLPWPLDQTNRIEAKRLQEVSTGDHLGEDHEGALLWTSQKKELEAHMHGDEHEDEALVLIPRAPAGAGQTPVNLIAVAASVHYRIRDVSQYAERSRDVKRLLKALTERELSFLFGREDLDQLLQDRVRHQATLRARLQKSADALQLGLTIESALLTDLHPPLSVGRDFEAPTAALEEARAEVWRAKALQAALEEQAAGDVATITAEASSRAAERVALTKAEASRFEALRALHAAAPEVFRTSRLLDELVAGSRGKRKLVVGKEGVLTELDLQEKVSVEELGLGTEMQDEHTKQGGQ